ncbi:MAG: hypothetical protein ACREHG_09745, partial [Candidatus Saccharimonadales bacterium]
GKASDINRQIGFAGIAIIWLFKLAIGQKIIVPAGLHLPAILIIASLAIDLLQYLIGWAIWQLFYMVKWKEHKDDEETVDAPDWCEWLLNIMFILKISSMVAAYVFLIRFICSKLA